MRMSTISPKSAEIQNCRKSTEKLVNRGSAVQVEELLNKQANKQTNKQKVLKVSSQFTHVYIIHACVNVCVYIYIFTYINPYRSSWLIPDFEPQVLGDVSYVIGLIS